MKKLLRSALSLAVAAMILLSLPLTAYALDDVYRFDDFAMSVRVPKNYYVITRDSARGDEAFSALGLNYDETLTAFHAADIYLRAYDPDGVFQLSLTVISTEQSKSVNNYSDLSDSERKAILDGFAAQPSVGSAAEIKHGGNIFFDTERTSELEGETLYINQCNTVINGLQIDISLQKPAESILADEAKVLTNLASSMSFDKITLRHTGPKFDWWRLLLWGLILIVLTIVISLIYKRQNMAARRRLEERRAKRVTLGADSEQEDGERSLTFDEALGYGFGESFDSRADAPLDSYDINVKNRDTDSGVNYFEDGGDSIDNKVDYFDSYFKEPTQARSGVSRLFSKLGAYIGIAFRHLGYFFKNLFGKKKH